MRERNLELEVPALEASRNIQILALLTEYGHGRCHELSSTLASYMDRPIGVVTDNTTGDVIHSCVVLENDRTLDAYGVNTVETTLERYARYARHGVDWKVGATIRDLIGDQSESDKMTVWEDVGPLLNFIGLGNVGQRGQEASYA